MRGWSTWLAASLLGACYSPRASRDCEVLCNTVTGDLCPDGLTCGTSGLCSAGGNACTGDMPDRPGICFGSGIARPCVPTVPPGTVTLSGPLDTNTDPLCVPDDQPVTGPQLCVIAGERITFFGPVHATGARPLVLVASKSINVNFMLDARSIRGATDAGAGAVSCPTPAGGEEGGISSGGAGGSFQSRGGDGGLANGVATTPADPAVAFPDHVRGGCPGGAGGPGTSSVPNKPGAGGGALYLIANERIDVQSVIAANGAGALLEAPDVGARAGGGGGGGGSGGLIVLESPLIMFGSEARLLALGGGGAGGGGGLASGASKAGGDPDPTAMSPGSISAVGGDAGQPDGGRGGDGSSTSSSAGSPGLPGTMAAGGGGGGGGAGFIKLHCTMCPTGSTIIIPPPSP
jgi:hypothetical protein